MFTRVSAQTSGARCSEIFDTNDSVDVKAVQRRGRAYADLGIEECSINTGDAPEHERIVCRYECPRSDRRGRCQVAVADICIPTDDRITNSGRICVSGVATDKCIVAAGGGAFPSSGTEKGIVVPGGVAFPRAVAEKGIVITGRV